jgi:aspartate racemase
VAGRDPLIGVLGGMGPLATADFMRRLALIAPAKVDQDHCRVLVYSNPKIPDRSAGILGAGPSPLPSLLDGVAMLERSGVDVIVIPCNTAHYWLDDLVASTLVPFISIFQAIRRDLASHDVRSGLIGVLGTAGTIRSGLFQRDLKSSGFGVLEPTQAEMEEFVEPAIRAVKASRIEAARPLVRAALAALAERGAAAVVLGCTELPLALDGDSPESGPLIVESTQSLAEACIAWTLEQTAAARSDARRWRGPDRKRRGA